jgi:hypothetical protein
MANLVKTKTGLSIFSVSILILIPLFESNFNAPVVIKRWSKLTWDDFQGFIQPFSRYEAAISSAIYLEYDSSRQTYHAYAGQNNVRSWAKKNSNGYLDYTLNHEQHHFNITELHARQLNQYISENPGESESLYLLRLRSINIDLRKMQRQYDFETNHGSLFGKQRRWEFKIDSLLLLDSGWVTDKFSGAKVFLPAKYMLSKGITDGKSRYREYSWNKYGMSFSLISFQNESYDDSTIDRIVANERNGVDILKSVTIDRNELFTKVSLIRKDSSSYTSYSVWYRDKSYLYYLSAKYPANTGDSTGYFQVAKSYLNSFSVVNTDSLWITKFEKSNSPITYSSASKANGTGHKDSRYCLTIEKAEKPGFYRGPIFRDDGGLVLPFDYLLDGDTLHYSDLLLINESIYAFDPTNDGQVFFIPSDKVPKLSYRIDFGYTLKKDSLKECYQFYHHSLQLQSQ